MDKLEKVNIQNFDPRLLDLLLFDNSAKRNIVWATADYSDLGESYAPECEIKVEQLVDGSEDVVKPRVVKAKCRQRERTRDKAEVFTPAWLCNAQNNLVDEEWFCRSCIFNTVIGESWKSIRAKIDFPAELGKTWQDYVRANRLEITCGEAPYLVSRYDTVTGKFIADVHDRIGLLDRKLRIVDENVYDERDWFAWIEEAYKSIYGYEYQGDNLLLARENLLFTFVDYTLFKWERWPTFEELKKIAHIISWNIWQMDGLTFTVPYSISQDKLGQMSLFDIDKEKNCAVNCLIRDWTNDSCIEFKELLQGGGC